MSSSKPQITMIGAGNLATRLGIALHERGYRILQVYSRTRGSAEALADRIRSTFTTDPGEIKNDADIYVFSVKDDALLSVLERLPKLDGLFVHTAGSVPLDIFASYSKRYGVIYPLQTFSKNRDVDFSKIPICIEASDEKELAEIQDLGESISDHVLPVNSEKRKYLHLAGVFTCNFVNRMYDIGSELLSRQGLPFDMLLPLIDETAAKVHLLSPYDAQTGPAVRYDSRIMEKHLDLLNTENLKTIYTLLSKNIHERHDPEKE